MKETIFSRIAILAIAIFFFASCTKPEEEDIKTDGKIQFSFSFINDNQARTLSDSASEPYSVIFSIEDAYGKVIYDKQEQVLSKNENGYITNSVSLPVGDYKLTEFIVATVNKSALYISPKSGSEKASLVSEPLPLQFSINKDAVLKLVPEVLSAIENKPEDFGYSSFSFNVVKTFDFLVTILTYSDSAKNFILNTASLKVFEGTKEVLTKQLTPITNKVTLRESDLIYKLVISKEGYENYTKEFSATDLKKYFSSSENGPLLVHLVAVKYPGLVAYFPFNGNANDVTGNGNNGTVYGAKLVADKFGKANSAYYFDGNYDYINIGTSPLIKRYKEDYSVSCWFKMDSYGSTYGKVLLSNRLNDTDYSGSQFGVGGILSDRYKKMSFVKNLMIINNVKYYDYFTTNMDHNLNTWYYATITSDYNGADSSKISIYVNGKLEASRTMAETTNPVNNPSIIGWEPSYYPVDYGFHGIIDEMKIYNRVLSQEEILSDYQKNL